MKKESLGSQKARFCNSCLQLLMMMKIKRREKRNSTMLITSICRGGSRKLSFRFTALMFVSRVKMHFQELQMNIRMPQV